MKSFKNIFAVFVSAVLLIAFSAYPDTVKSSVTYSLRLCYSSVIPSLFPFFIICELFILSVCRLGFSPKSFAFATGLISGFPTGVKNICRLYTEKSITRSEARALLYCTANASPAYIVTFVGVCLMHSKKAGIILLISQTACAVICAAAFGCLRPSQGRRLSGSVLSVTDIACQSVSSSVISCLYVCGYTVFFGIIADIASHIGLAELISHIFPFMPKAGLRALLLGTIEITRGITALDMTQGFALPAAAAIIGFSGISVIMQCMSAVLKAELPKAPLIIGKLIYTVGMPVISYILWAISSNNGISGANAAVPTALTATVTAAACIYSLYNSFDKSKQRMYNKGKRN